MSWQIAETLPAAAGNDEIVFDPHTAAIWQIDARFYGECHPLLQGLVVVGTDIGLFMALQPQTMSCAMGEEFSITSTLDDFPGGSIHLACRHTGICGFTGSSIGFSYDLGNARQLGIGFANRKGAGKVGHITIHGSTPVDNEQVAW